MIVVWTSAVGFVERRREGETARVDSPVYPLDPSSFPPFSKVVTPTDKVVFCLSSQSSGQFKLGADWRKAISYEQ